MSDRGRLQPQRERLPPPLPLSHRVEVPDSGRGDPVRAGLLALGLPAEERAGRLLPAPQRRRRLLLHRHHRLLHVQPGMGFLNIIHWFHTTFQQ